MFNGKALCRRCVSTVTSYGIARWGNFSYVRHSVVDPDPGFGAFLTLNLGWVKSQDPDPG